MIRSVHLNPPPGDWIAYQIDEATDTGWRTIAARPAPETGFPAGGFSTAAQFDDATTTYRAIWVGLGGSKNMRIGPATDLDDQPSRGATYGG